MMRRKHRRILSVLFLFCQNMPRIVDNAAAAKYNEDDAVCRYFVPDGGTVGH